MDTEDIIKVEDSEQGCLECIFLYEESCNENDLIERLNEIHGKCYKSDHHYEKR